MLPAGVHPIQANGIQPDLSLAQGNFEGGKSGECARETPVQQGVHCVLPQQRGGDDQLESGAVAGSFDDEPTCRLTTVPVRSHAANSGSHAAGIEAREPQGVRTFGERDRERALGGAALDLASGELDVPQGNDRQRYEPAVPSPPHHSSIIQSLKARTQRRAKSLSCRVEEHLPAETDDCRESTPTPRCGSDPSPRGVPPVCQQPGAMSSYVTGCNSCRSRWSARARPGVQRPPDLLVAPHVCPRSPVLITLEERGTTARITHDPLASLVRGHPAGIGRREPEIQRSGGSTTWSSTEINRSATGMFVPLPGAPSTVICLLASKQPLDNVCTREIYW